MGDVRWILNAKEIELVISSLGVLEKVDVLELINCDYFKELMEWRLLFGSWNKEKIKIRF